VSACVYLPSKIWYQLYSLILKETLVSSCLPIKSLSKILLNLYCASCIWSSIWCIMCCFEASLTMIFRVLVQDRSKSRSRSAQRSALRIAWVKALHLLLESEFSDVELLDHTLHWSLLVPLWLWIAQLLLGVCHQFSLSAFKLFSLTNPSSGTMALVSCFGLLLMQASGLGKPVDLRQLMSDSFSLNYMR
jgi:hypothetical protein